MKKSGRYLTIVLIICFVFSGFTYAAENSVKIIINGNELPVKGSIVQNRTLVPVRALSEALHADVNWENATKKVTLTKMMYRVNRETDAESIESVTISMWIGKKDVLINGQSASLEVAPQIIGGSTMLPARAVAEWLEATVEWDNANRAVLVSKGLNNSYAEARQKIEEENWISAADLNEKGIIFVQDTKSKTGFYTFDQQTGTAGPQIFATPDFDKVALERQTPPEKAFNSVSMKIKDGVLYFKTADLQRLDVME